MNFANAYTVIIQENGQVVTQCTHRSMNVAREDARLYCDGRYGIGKWGKATDWAGKISTNTSREFWNIETNA